MTAAAYAGGVPLDEYRRKRDPRRTPEPLPAGEPAPSGPGAAQPGGRFVVQEHHASSLHWDLRLERDGVLASWAVPKGLPVDTETLRLAVQTEDHPLEYLDFSGEIPAGEYGGGRMTIWDSGRYEAEKWSHREIAFTLHGTRAGGRFVLVRGNREDDREHRRSWLLKRTEAQPGRVPLPHDLRPMEAVPGELPGGAGWLLQARFGGRRVLVRVDGGRATVLAPSAGGSGSVELKAPTLGGLGPSVGATALLLDGELTAAGELWIGDLLHLDGRDTTAVPFRDRRALLEGLTSSGRLSGPHWRLAPVFPGEQAEAVLAGIEAQGLPGLIAKRADSAYLPGARDDTWVAVAGEAGKTPATRTQPSGRPPEPGPHDTARQNRTGVGRARLTNPDKILYPQTGTTKADVLGHYLAVADAILPHLAGRPVTMVRWPDGVERPSFFEKDVSRHAPDWIRTERLGTPGGRSEFAWFPIIETVEGLAWAANLAALELHVPQWRVGPRGGRREPDLVVFDLDPGDGATVVDCCRVAERIAELLAADGLVGYPRTSGGKGLQLYLPVAVSRAEQTAEFAHDVADRLAAAWPQKVVSVMAKARRRGRVFVDWSQNNTAKTTIASYSLRGRGRPTVATPVTWDEVRACRRPEELTFTIDDLPGRLAAHGDLLAPLLFTERQRLPRRSAASPDEKVRR